MLLFIFLPIVSVITQSLHIDHEQVFIEVENCDIFGCKKATTVDTEATAQLRAEEPLGRFVGLSNYFNRSHLASSEVAKAWRETESFGEFYDQVYNLPLYRAIIFTLVYTFTVTPLLIIPSTIKGHGHLLFFTANDRYTSGGFADTFLDDRFAWNNRQFASTPIQRSRFIIKGVYVAYLDNVDRLTNPAARHIRICHDRWRESLGANTLCHHSTPDATGYVCGPHSVNG